MLNDVQKRRKRSNSRLRLFLNPAFFALDFVFAGFLFDS
jgi:hypothetical protein